VAQTAQTRTKRDPAMFFRRVETKLGIVPVRSDRDLERLVASHLPLSSLASLSSNGISSEEIYEFIVPRRTLSHRMAHAKPLTWEESDRVVRLARIVSQAEEVFGDNAKAARWLRKGKPRFDGHSPLEMLKTEAGSRLVEEMLLQLDYGFAA
jgi:putative toxin-antitoxin system antitoxin component (TIGR02293 family)